ncbi:thioredoxin domain-containing protein 9 [Nilaparvata lugens]|uniref:thioredoxin domain-containing protein 9 n=1 Tax=Nilaparvata lugens TaxID=108931 RepID=UPI000B994E34|nr:thioredoxin domain-containing protein 9 [Nilaparvata lugens]XP_022195907.1 thioredoxin domain-containing protein 9 [Nilaparvata lugens]
MESIIKNQVLQVAEQVEKHLDSELQRLDELDSDGIEQLRQQRLKQLKEHAKQKQIWLSNGHGEYEELAEEKEFFNATKKSPDMVVHFYKDDTPRCKIVDHHLKILAKKHLEAKFLKLNVERCPFLTERLRIRVIPTIALVKDSKTKDFVVGFTELGNCDDFTTEMLEWRIAQSGAIEYNGDLLNPPDAKKVEKKNLLQKKTIRGRNDSDSDDSDLDF